MCFDAPHFGTLAHKYESTQRNYWKLFTRRLMHPRVSDRLLSSAVEGSESSRANMRMSTHAQTDTLTSDSFAQAGRPATSHVPRARKPRRRRHGGQHAAARPLSTGGLGFGWPRCGTRVAACVDRPTRAIRAAPNAHSTARYGNQNRGRDTAIRFKHEAKKQKKRAVLYS